MNEQKILRQFAENLRMEFAVKDISVYRNMKKIYGKNIDNVDLDKYLSLSCSTVFKTDSSSVLVTRFVSEKGSCIFVIYSDNAAAFDGQEAEYIISDIKKIKGKIGD